MKLGYIRVSKQEQNEALQKDALKEAGCEKYFSDKITGSKFERKGLEDLLAFVRPGDTVIVWKLDRLGRSLKDLIETLNMLKDLGVDFISLTEKLNRERTNAGLAAARARGRVGGRPRRASDGKVALARLGIKTPSLGS